MVKTRLFDGLELPLTIFNSQALIDHQFTFITTEECIPGTVVENEFKFPGFISAYFRVYNEREGFLIKDLQFSKDGNTLIANFSVDDMTFDDIGKYYYEIGYSNGYDLVLRYGKLTVI